MFGRRSDSGIFESDKDKQKRKKSCAEFIEPGRGWAMETDEAMDAQRQDVPQTDVIARGPRVGEENEGRMEFGC